MSRPALRELSLDRFILPPPSAFPSSPSKSTRPTKRTLSPGPILFSPTKRRILTQEGVLCSAKTVKSPLWSRQQSQPLFASSSASQRDGPPALQSAPALLEHDCSPSGPSPSISTVSLSEPTIVSRPLPLSADPSSIHYPGFLVHKDDHIVMYHNQPTLLPNEADEPIDDKENSRPRRKLKKVLAPSTEVKTPTLNLSPRKSLGHENSRTPRPPAFSLLSAQSRTLSPEERKERRRIMEEEDDWARQEDLDELDDMLT